MKLLGSVINTSDPAALASFYAALLEWPRMMNEPNWVAIRHPEGGTAIAFQRAPGAARPTLTPVPGEPHALMHLDIGSDDLERDVARAVSLGATEHSRSTDGRECVLVDPDGNGPRLYLQRVPEPKHAKNRVHLDIQVPADERRAEVERLVALGAVSGDEHTMDPNDSDAFWIVMQDPEGNEFCIGS